MKSVSGPARIAWMPFTCWMAEIMLAALKAYARAFTFSAPVVLREFHRVIFAILGLLGLGSLRRVYTWRRAAKFVRLKMKRNSLMENKSSYWFFGNRYTLIATVVLAFALGLGIRFFDLTDLPLDFSPTRQMFSAAQGAQHVL